MSNLDDALELNKHEKSFHVYPIGIKYTCEFCNEGEMIIDTSKQKEHNLFPHTCTKCHKTMFLPKMYPYIEWKTYEI